MAETQATVKQKRKPTAPSDVGMWHVTVRGSHKADEGQMTASQVCSKCSPIKITVSQASEFVVNLTQKLKF